MNVEDAQMFRINDMHQHLEEPKARAGLLCADRSSTDNNMALCHLVEILPPIPAHFMLLPFCD